MAKKTKRVRRSLTATEQKRLNKSRKAAEAERADIVARGRAVKAEMSELIGTAQQILRDERERQGLSLADLRERTGFTRPGICRLETDDNANPTLRTLARYAAALGKRVNIELID